MCIRDSISTKPQNIFQIKVFNKLDVDYETYFSMQVDTDTLFDPVEFPFSKFHGKKVDQFLTRTLHSVLNSSRGEIKSLSIRPWRTFSTARKLAPEMMEKSAAGSSDESIIRSLQILEDSIRNYRIILSQTDNIPGLKESGNGIACNKILKKIETEMSWENYYKCASAAKLKKRADLISIEECRPVVDSISTINVDPDCINTVYKESSGNTFLSKKIYLPLELKVYPQDDSSIYLSENSDYRFNDDKQVKDLPPNIVPGQTMDLTGSLYSMDCIEKKTMKLTQSYEKRDEVITTDYYPHSLRKKSLWCRIFLFWKKFSERTRFRGSFEITGYSRKLSPDFSLTKKAELLASENINEFYRKYGTHYVSQVKQRRGFVYYFSFNSPDDEDIEVIPFGISEKAMYGMPGMEQQEIPGSCTASILNFFKKKKKNPLLEPETVKGFFKNKEQLIYLFKDDSNAIPLSISLEPWSEYFKSSGILKPHQLDIRYGVR